MASSSTSAPNSQLDAPESNVAGSGEQDYPYPSYVHRCNFVSFKLVGKTNFRVWHEQISCLLESHGMQGFVDGTIQNPKENINEDSKMKVSEAAVEANYGKWKRSDTLVKGWIFGSLCEDVMDTVVGLETANDVWKKLIMTFGPWRVAEAAPPTVTLVGTTITSTNNKDLAAYIPMCRAIQTGDWEKTHELLNMDKDSLTAKLTGAGDTAIHLAIQIGADLQFIENLLNEMDSNRLPTLVDDYGFNPAHEAARVGNTAAARMLVTKNPHVLFIAEKKGFLPIHKAAFIPHKKTFRYLLEVTKRYIDLSTKEGHQHPFEGRSGIRFLNNIIHYGFVDVAYELIKDYPEMVTKTYDVHPPLATVADTVHLHYSGTHYNFYKRLVYSYIPLENFDDTEKVQDVVSQEMYKDKFVIKCRSHFHAVMDFMSVKFWKVLLHVPHIKHLIEDKVKHHTAIKLLRFMCEEISKIDEISEIRRHYSVAMDEAATNNSPEPIEEIAKYFPQATALSIKDYSIIQVAIINRNEKVYNLMVYQLNINKSIINTRIDKDRNNLLHLAGQLAPIAKLNEVSGAALQMQRELQWFQEVEKFIQPQFKDYKNSKEETPLMMFRREHKQMRKEGEEWMKKTADSYTITTALIITIVFAAAITVPGGNNGNTGKAIYVKRPTFITFAVSDAISMLTATTSLLLFQSILTARYAEDDFLFRLPHRLILGLVSLFFSVVFMLVAYSTSLYILIGHGKSLNLALIATFSCLPVASFVILQLPLLVELVSSTYGRGIFGKQHVRRSYM